jgi:hypothetical protein
VGWRPKDAPELVRVDLYSRHADARPAPFSADEARQIIEHLRQACPYRRLGLAAEAAWHGGLRIACADEWCVGFGARAVARLEVTWPSRPSGRLEMAVRISRVF